MSDGDAGDFLARLTAKLATAGIPHMVVDHSPVLTDAVGRATSFCESVGVLRLVEADEGTFPVKHERPLDELAVRGERR
jgi:hypothetical protein